LEKTWDRLVPDTPFTYSKYEEEIAHTLLDYQVLLKTMRFLALMLIAIASLGLLGMAFYSAETKKKEIGIRKVLGASIFHITKFLTKGYFNLLLTAIFIAAPLSWILCNFFLQQFVYRIRLGIDIFLLGIFLMLVCGLGTVLSQTIKAAIANPIDSIKYE
jgi:putative ABC transport system permease protein